jgi:cytochrome c-type biogenesis protein CcmF
MFVLFFKNYKKIPAIHSEEETSSREFYMFIGSLLIFLSALFIILITSIPVYSKTPFLKDLIIKIHKGPLAMPEDAEFLYNKVMIMVSIIIGILTAVTQYLKYKNTSRQYLIDKIKFPIIVSIAVATLIFIIYPIHYDKHGIGFLVAIYIALFVSIYAAISNAMYISLVLKNNLKPAGASIAHFGFALMIVGMLISSSNKTVISDSKVNGINVPIGKDPMSKKEEDPTENLSLIREVPTKMGDYQVSYLKDSSGQEKGRNFYLLNFEKKNKTTSKVEEQFILQPDVYMMKDNNMSSNPDTKSYLTKDIFTYISFALGKENKTDTAQFKIIDIGEGEKSYYSNGYFILNKVSKNPANSKYKFGENDIALQAEIQFVSKDSMHFDARPMIVVDSFGILQIDDTVYAQNLFVKFAGVSENHKIKLGIKESDQLIDFVTVKSYVFPYINLVWLGLIIMAMGLLMSAVFRSKFSNRLSGLILLMAFIGLFYMFLLAN